LIADRATRRLDHRDGPRRTLAVTVGCADPLGCLDPSRFAGSGTRKGGARLLSRGKAAREPRNSPRMSFFSDRLLEYSVMIVGVPRESYPGERRVALVPGVLPALAKAGCEVIVEGGAGAAAGFPDALYAERGARLAPSRAEVFGSSDAVLQVLCHGANDKTGRHDLGLLRRDQVLMGFLRPLGSPETVREIAATGAVAFAVELMPRLTRAQSMDALSAMSTVAGYKAVLLAASALPRMFPMLMTAAGTITPARVLVVGAGVAGLQAIATARKLGAVVSAYDIRPAAKQEVESLAARFVELPLEAGDVQDRYGYARAQDESFYRRQRELLARVVRESDVVITTAVVPGRKAPVLVTADMVAGMAPGSVIVDLAAERGGNCELTRPDETIVEHGVTIVGTVNLAGTVPFHASQLYAKTLSTFFLHLVKDGKLQLNMDDEITRETLVTRGGEVVHPRVLEALGVAPPEGRGDS
jgi:NAD(P) transhydrogenase subunit alpha